MSILERIRQRAAAKLQHIVLPEGNDPRTVVAAAICARNRMARITLLGDESTIRETAQREGADLGGVEVIDHRRASDFEKMASLFHELRRAKGMMADEARTLMSDPLYYGNLMVRLGKADGSVAGATGPFLAGLLGDATSLPFALVVVACIALTTVPMVWALRPAFR